MLWKFGPAPMSTLIFACRQGDGQWSMMRLCWSSGKCTNWSSTGIAPWRAWNWWWICCSLYENLDVWISQNHLCCQRWGEELRNGSHKRSFSLRKTIYGTCLKVLGRIFWMQVSQSTQNQILVACPSCPWFQCPSFSGFFAHILARSVLPALSSRPSHCLICDQHFPGQYRRNGMGCQSVDQMVIQLSSDSGRVHS